MSKKFRDCSVTVQDASVLVDNEQGYESVRIYRHAQTIDTDHGTVWQRILDNERDAELLPEAVAAIRHLAHEKTRSMGLPWTEGGSYAGSYPMLQSFLDKLPPEAEPKQEAKVAHCCCVSPGGTPCCRAMGHDGNHYAHLGGDANCLRLAEWSDAPTVAEIDLALVASASHWAENLVAGVKGATIRESHCALCVLFKPTNGQHNGCVLSGHDRGGCCEEWHAANRAFDAQDAPAFRTACVGMLTRIEAELAKLRGGGK